MFLNTNWASSSDGSHLRVIYKPTDVGLQLKFPLRWGAMHFQPLVTMSQPLNSFSNITNELITSDGVQKLEAGAWSYLRILNSLYPFLYSGFVYKSQGLSNLLTVKTGVLLNSYLKHKSFLQIGLLGVGFQSIVPDEYSTSPSRRTNILEKLNGSSFRYYSVNPSNIDLGGWIGIKTPNLGASHSTHQKYLWTQLQSRL